MKSILLIINADDLGISKSVNDTTFKLMDKGKVTSATIISNAPSLEEAVEKTTFFPHCSFGVHLNITDFQPLTSNKALDKITDKFGNFIGFDNFKKVDIEADLANAIYNEFCAQIDKLISLGVKISHIDTHHHLHTNLTLFFILKKIQKKYNIRKIRISRNIYPLRYEVTKFMVIKKKLYNLFLRYYYPTNTTDGFGNFISFYDNARLDKLKYYSIEAMVHPSENKSYEKEIELLLGDWEKDIPLRIKLINYNQL